MKYAKRIIAVLLSLVLLTATAACGNNDAYDAEKQALHEQLYGNLDIPTASAANISLFDTITANFSLAYSRTDYLNPYRAESTLNMTISSLIFDKLYVFDSDYEIQPIVARSVEQSGKEVIVTLRSGLVFSDGSEITADDVEYSFYAAKRSESKYSNQLSNFRTCSKDGLTLTFLIKDDDPLAYMLLDFPIIKKESDAAGAMPIGSGKYVYVSDQDQGIYLELNERWYNPEKPSIERISLTSMPTIESIVHSIEIGTVSYYMTDLRDGYPTRVNAQFTTFDINNLVFLGVNTNDTRLLNINVRTAMSLALDRDAVSTKAFGGRAYGASGPLSSGWKTAASMQVGSTTADIVSAAYLLNNAGYVNTDSNGYRYDSLGNYLTFTLAVSAGNERHMTAADVIASQLAQVGIRVIVEQVPAADFVNTIKSGNYQLYVAEYSMKNNMDFSALHTPGSGLYNGVTFEEIVATRTAYLAGSGTEHLEPYIDAVTACLPFIPVCFRLGMVCYSRSIIADMQVTESDPFYGMTEWRVVAAEAEDESE